MKHSVACIKRRAKCGAAIPLQLLTEHIKSCNIIDIDSDENLAVVEDSCEQEKVCCESDMFIMAGRMVGHSFVHGGPCLSGLSPAVVHVLLGGSPETATVTLEDCPDLEIRATIRLVCFQSNPIISSLIYTLNEESLHPFSYFFSVCCIILWKKS
ncbi:hypothetical protein F7725_013600 [Dissostichus mawsoni]|uniref:Uncharacterized protein n=1 Tax=Dissostichus mawsoni TaxID=36200 RepID=A0A7J5Y6C1_DISMA|nr:hypothetical protein F7725_013600 [Dissostichus mawsoni]